MAEAHRWLTTEGNEKQRVKEGKEKEGKEEGDLYLPYVLHPLEGSYPMFVSAACPTNSVLRIRAPLSLPKILSAFVWYLLTVPRVRYIHTSSSGL